MEKRKLTAVSKILIAVIIIAALLCAGFLGWRAYTLMSEDSVEATENDSREKDSDSSDRGRGRRRDEKASEAESGETENPGVDASPLPAENETVAEAPAEELPAVVETPRPDEAAPVELAPDFTMKDTDGNTHYLSDYYGMPIVVNFWASWCGPCMSELGHFDEAIKEFDGQVQFLMVDVISWEEDTGENILEWLHYYTEYDFPVLFDDAESGVNAYRIEAIPVTLFINANGSLNRVQVGSMNRDILYQYIHEILD